ENTSNGINLEIKSIDIFLFNEVCDSYVHPDPSTLSTYGLKISLSNYSDDTIRVQFHSNHSVLRDKQLFFQTFELFKINDSMVKYKDFDNEVIKISPRDSITFTLSDETISDTRFHFFDTYLNYILSK